MASQPDQQTVDDVSYIMSSDYRMAVVEALNDGMATPSTICEFHGGREELAIAHASRTLQELKKRNIVDLLVSEDTQKGRIYGLTEQGREATNTPWRCKMLVQAILAFIGLVFGILCYVSYAASRVDIRRRTDYPPRYDR